MYAVFGYSFAAEMERAVKKGMDGLKAANHAATRMDKRKGKAYQVSPDFVRLDTAKQFVAMCADGRAVLCLEIRQMGVTYDKHGEHPQKNYIQLKKYT